MWWGPRGLWLVLTLPILGRLPLHACSFSSATALSRGAPGPCSCLVMGSVLGSHSPGLSSPEQGSRSCPPAPCLAVKHSVGVTLFLFHFAELWAVAWSCECLPEVTLSHWRNLAPNLNFTLPGCDFCQLGSSLPPESISGSSILMPSHCRNETQGSVAPGLGSHSCCVIGLQNPFNFLFTCCPGKGGWASLASEPFQAVSPSQSPPEPPAKLLEAGPQSSLEAHWTISEGFHSSFCPS